MAKTKIGGITVEIGADTSGLSKKLKDVETESRKTKSELKSVNDALKQAPNSVDLWKQKQELLSKAVENSKKKLEALVSEQNNMLEGLKNGKVTEETYKAYQREIEITKGKIESAEKALEDFEKESKSTGETGKKAAEDMGKAFEDAGTKISNAGEKISGVGEKLLPVTAAITAIGGVSVKGAVEFEDAIAKLGTIADENEVPLSELEEQVKSLSNETGIAASEIAENAYNAISAGQSTKDAVNFVAQSTKLAKAGFADSAAALDILTTTLNAYGMEASEVNRVSDILINTQNLGKTTVGELAGSMGKVIPTAKAAGVSLENLASSYAIMTANGVNTAEAGTYIKAMLTELSKSGTKADEALRKVSGNKGFAELTAEGKSLAEILQMMNSVSGAKIVDTDEIAKANDKIAQAKLNQANAQKAYDKAVSKYGKTSKEAEEADTKLKIATNKLATAENELQAAMSGSESQLIDMFGSAQAGTAALVLLSNGTEGYNEVLDSMGDSAGATDAAFEKLQTTSTQAKIALNQLKNSAIELGTTILQMLQPSIKKVTESIKTLTTRFNSLSNSQKQTIVKIAGVVAAAGPLLIVIGKITSGVGGLISSVGSLFKLAAANPWVLAIGAVVAALAVLYVKNEEFRNFVNDTAKEILEFIKEIGKELKQWYEDNKPLIDDMIKVLTFLADVTLKFLMKTVKDTMNSFKLAWTVISATWSVATSFFKTIWENIKQIFSVVKSVLTGDFSGAWDGIKEIFSNTGEFFEGVWNSIKNVFSGIGGFFYNKFNDAWDYAKKAFGLEKVGNAFTEVKDTIVNAFKVIPEAIENIFKEALEKVKGVAGEIGDTIDEVTDKIPGVKQLKSAAKKAGSYLNPKNWFANGGTLSKNGDMAVVGEAGPELLQLLNGKAVVTPFNGNAPAMQTTASTAGNRTTVHQTFNINVKEFSTSKDARTTSQELARLQRQTDFGKGMVTV